MAEEVTSKNQQGGITAHTVTFSPAQPPSQNLSTPIAEPQQKKSKRLGMWLSAGVALVVAGTAFLANAAKVFEWLGWKPNPISNATAHTSQATDADSKPMQNVRDQFPESKPMPDSNHNVTSYNQLGGITAHTVNIGAQPRSITPDFERELTRITQGYKKFTVTCVLGDGEAFQFANAVMASLKARGLNVEGVNQAVYTVPVLGQQMRPDGETLHLIIGTKQ